jgi:hypothetical protein
VVNWFRRERKRVVAPRLRVRASGNKVSNKVDLADLTPDLTTFLGKAAYVQLMIFENLGRVVSTAPSVDAKTMLSEVAGFALAKHRGLVAEIESRGTDAATVMKPFVGEVDSFQRMTQGNDWYEAVATCYLSAGFLNDFLVRLAGGVTASAAPRILEILESESGDALLERELLGLVQGNPRLAARLALWGRRLVGDTMLIARWMLRPTENHDSDEARIEPVFTELIAAHTRRMDALGLTA